MTSLYVRATGKYEKINFNESVEEFCKRKCFEAGAPLDSFDDYDNWKQLFHDHYTDHVVCGDSVYRLYDVNDGLANGDDGSIVGVNSFLLYYDYYKNNLRDAFEINK